MQSCYTINPSKALGYFLPIIPSRLLKIFGIILSILLRINSEVWPLRLSTKGQYAVRAMLVLALHQAEVPISLRRISQMEDISEQYLGQIFAELRKEKLVRGVRGAAGGYQLRRPSDEITAGDILRAVEGPIAPVECVRDNQSGACQRVNVCVTRELWIRLRDSMSAVLDHTTLADLAGMTVQEHEEEED